MVDDIDTFIPLRQTLTDKRMVLTVLDDIGPVYFVDSLVGPFDQSMITSTVQRILDMFIQCRAPLANNRSG